MDDGGVDRILGNYGVLVNYRLMAGWLAGSSAVVRTVVAAPRYPDKLPDADVSSLGR